MARSKRTASAILRAVVASSLFVFATRLASVVHEIAFVGNHVSPPVRIPTRMMAFGNLGGLGGLGGLGSMQELEEMMKDEGKMKQLQAQAEEIMKDPEKRKMFDQFSGQMQSIVEGLQNDPDPEMREFFKDIQTGGMSAMQKWQSNEKVLRKFSEASRDKMGGLMGGMPGMPGMNPTAGSAAPSSTITAAQLKPGDEVIVHSLAKAPHLNGKKAMVVPPTEQEKATLKDTGRLIVRLMDTGEQFAVKPDNLRTPAQEASHLVGSSLEDVSLGNPALQSEAAKLRESGKLGQLEEDPELKPVFEDIKKNGMTALEKYWNDEALMRKINAHMQAS